jgi:hypothetical protein
MTSTDISSQHGSDKGTEMSEWQPIETAPQDWSDVLVYAPNFPSEFRKVGEAYFNPESGKWRSPTTRRQLHPTHWQPLPAPPHTHQ